MGWGVLALLTALVLLRRPPMMVAISPLMASMRVSFAEVFLSIPL